MVAEEEVTEIFVSLVSIVLANIDRASLLRDESQPHIHAPTLHSFRQSSYNVGIFVSRDADVRFLNITKNKRIDP